MRKADRRAYKRNCYEVCVKNGAEPIYNSFVTIPNEDINYIPDNNHLRYLRGHCKLVIEIDLN